MSVVDRLGITATGLESIAPTSVRGWLDRVRSGALTETQRNATIRLVFRVWLIAFLLKALGSGWDVAWHFRFFRDDFAPPHDINLVGDGIAIALVLGHWYTRFAVDRLALRLMIGGVSLFVLSAPIDVINHRVNGLDITSWSVTHFGLYTGTAIMIAGVIRAWSRFGTAAPRYRLVLGALWVFFFENVWFAAQQQEYGVIALRNFIAGHPTADPELLEFARNQAGAPVLDVATFKSFALPIPDWVYPLWMVAAAVLVLLLARRSIGARWAATGVAAAYVAWRCLMWPILAGIGFPHSTVPFVLLLAGVAVDLSCLARLAWPVEAVIGAVAATAMVYAGLWLQSELIAAPPVSYWSAPIAAVVLAILWALARSLVRNPQRP